LKHIAWGVAVLLMALTGTLLSVQWILTRPLPRMSGTIPLEELEQQVIIVRDSSGVPYIRALNERDLYVGMGFAMAQDRLWQMDFHRRLGQGRLAEVLGHELVPVDRHFRMFSPPPQPSGETDEFSFVAECFAQGVNAFIRTQENRLPLEFKLLRYRPESWDAEDYLSVLKVVAWGLSSGWRVDLTAARILEHVGERHFRDAFPSWPDERLRIANSRISGIPSWPPSLRGGPERLNDVVLFSSSWASNSWVVDGSRSSTGKPLLANDTHLPLTNPSFWWEVHLSSPSLEVSGFAVPGAPAVAIGHNRHVAWGITNVMVDDVDFYVERIHPEDPERVQWNGEWESIRTVVHTIPVRNSEPVRTSIRYTRHGPVISDEEEVPGDVISARWAFGERRPSLRAPHLLAQAHDVFEAVQALTSWEIPAQNLVLADSHGNIGYWCCAAAPIRPVGDGLLPAPGWTSEYAWQGFLPFEERPWSLNPENGWIATANNKVGDSTQGVPLHGYWEPVDRILQIHRLLRTREVFSPEDFMHMQQDVECPLAAELAPRILRVAETRLDPKNAGEAYSLMNGWDRVMSPNSEAACLHEFVFRNLMDEIFRDELGDSLFEEYLKTTHFVARAMRRILVTGDSPWVNRIHTPEKETLDDLVETALRKALSDLKKDGNGPDYLRWGEAHTITFQHVLGRNRFLGRFLNLGPFPAGGNHLTVNKQQYPYDRPYAATLGVSQRFIVDLNPPITSYRVLPTGQSGHAKSPHHADQLQLYFEGGYRQFRFVDWEVETPAGTMLLLTPIGVRNPT